MLQQIDRLPLAIKAQDLGTTKQARACGTARAGHQAQLSRMVLNGCREVTTSETDRRLNVPAGRRPDVPA
jgi:hypothetical protein